MTVRRAEYDRVLNELERVQSDLDDALKVVAAEIIKNGGEINLPRNVLVSLPRELVLHTERDAGGLRLWVSQRPAPPREAY